MLLGVEKTRVNYLLIRLNGLKLINGVREQIIHPNSITDSSAEKILIAFSPHYIVKELIFKKVPSLVGTIIFTKVWPANFLT